MRDDNERRYDGFAVASLQPSPHLPFFFLSFSADPTASPRRTSSNFRTTGSQEPSIPRTWFAAVVPVSIIRRVLIQIRHCLKGWHKAPKNFPSKTSETCHERKEASAGREVSYSAMQYTVVASFLPSLASPPQPS